MLKIIYRINIIYIYNNKNSNILKIFNYYNINSILLNEHYEKFFQIYSKNENIKASTIKNVLLIKEELNTNFLSTKKSLYIFFKEKMNPLNLVKNINLTLH